MSKAVPDNRRKIYRRTEDLYRKSVEDVKDYAIFMTDPHGDVINWNLGAQHILGFTESEIIGKNASRFFTAEDRTRREPEKELLTAAQNGRAEDERWHVRRDGSRFWASGVVTPVRDDNGLLLGFTKVMRDMTERNRLAEERDRFFTLSVDMLCIVHLDGRLQRINPAWEKTLGFSEPELFAMPIFDWVHPEDRAATIREYEKLSRGEATAFMENRLLCKDGTYKWIAWSYYPVPEDGLAFGVGRDITELKRIQQVLSLRAEELEQANHVKDEFLATLSHELRTPLTSILGWSRLLRANKLNEVDRERAIQIIQRNAEAQAKLIEDLLDVSRIITGKLKMEFQPLSLPSIVETVVNGQTPAADAKNLKVETLLDPAAGPVLGDPTRMQQIVTNLLSNAIKFTPDGGTIQVRVERADSHARLQVIDSGIGIRPEDLPHIFERFKQADSSNVRAHSGLGLGLAIVDHLVRQQDGVVYAESDGFEHGATFTVEFPLAATEVLISAEGRVDLFSPRGQALLAESDDLSDRVSLNGIRVLVVEDEPDTRELLKTILERCGAEVAAVESSRAALAELSRATPTVVVSDIGMAGENGYDLIEKIRSLPPEEGGRIPAVALTAYAAPADRRRALVAGFQTHLAKPVEPDELLAVIANLTGQEINY